MKYEYAFPIADVYHPNGQIEYGKPGLTKREYFVAAAMQGYLSNTKNIFHFHPEDDAKYIVKIADATLAAMEAE